MKLSDIMSHAGLAIYAEIALIIFLAVWVIATVRTLLRRSDAEFESARRLPFTDEPAAPATTASAIARGLGED